MDFSKHCHVQFGAYIKAHDDPDISNTICDQTTPCIALGPTGNFQGSITCFDLETSHVLKHCTVTLLPMPDRVVKKVMQ